MQAGAAGTHSKEGASISLTAISIERGGASSDLRPLCSMSQFIDRGARSFTLISVDQLRERALALVDEELDRLRGLGPQAVRALAGQHDDTRDDLVVSTRVQQEDDRLLVLVEAWRGPTHAGHRRVRHGSPTVHPYAPLARRRHQRSRSARRSV